MPEIVLNGGQNDILTVLAAMLFPNDEERQQQYISVDQVSRIYPYKNNNIYGISDSASIQSLMNAPSLNDFQDKIIPKLSNKALIVGDMLASQYLLYHHTSEPPNLRKANFIVVQREKWLLANGDVSKDISEHTAYNYWKENKPVAHLWAAYRLNAEFPYDEGKGVFHEDIFPKFLSVAAHIQDFATTFIPAKAKYPMLDLNEIWSLPEYVTRRQLKGKLDLTPLRNILKHYEPKK